MRLLNDPRPWWGTLRGRPLRMAELIAGETISAEAAAAVWWAMQHGASVFVAAGPPGAGKSTLATALLEFLPEPAQLYVTAGAWDSLDVPLEQGAPTYLLINELSYHLPMYLSGVAARQAFSLLQHGIRMIGTLHARSAREAVVVMCDEADLAPAELLTGFVIPVVSAAWRGQRLLRQVTELGFVAPGGHVTPLASLAPADPPAAGDRAAPTRLRLDVSGLGALADWAGAPLASLQAAIADRATRLRG